MSKNKKADRTRAEILDTAWRLIASEGADVSMSKIAAEVGMTRQSMYVHFGSRGGLLMALVQRADAREDIWGAFKKAEAFADPIERLEAILTTWFAFVPTIYPVARDLIRLKAKDSEASAAWYDRMDDLYAFYLGQMKAIHAQGLLKDGLTAERAADMLWALTSVQQWELLVHDRGWESQAAAKQLTDMAIAAALKS